MTMRLRRLFELTAPHVEKKFDPGLMTIREYHDALNPNNKSHPSSAYDSNLKQINRFEKKTEYDTLIRRIKIHNVPFEIRLRKIDLSQQRYVKQDQDGNIIRDEKGNAITFTPEELMLPKKDRWEYSLGAFYGDTMVAYTADEWGCMLVVVAQEYRGWGIGPIILRMARELEPDKTSGGFTPQGYYNLVKVHNTIVREYLANGMYSYLVKSGQMTADRAKAIIRSAGGRPKPKEQFNLNTNDPADWFLYGGEAGDFIIYDRKLRDLTERGVIDSDNFTYWANEMLIGGVYASGTPPYAFVHQFGGKTEGVKMFLMRLALTVLSQHQETLRVTPEVAKYVNQPGVEINGDQATLVSNPIDYHGMVALEAKWRKSFDRYDEFRYRILEMAMAKFQIDR